MDRPEEPQDGVVYVQNITVIGDGQVNAVQHGDQYNYIYRGTPPYRVEPFPLVAPATVPIGLARVPSRLLTARYQVVPFLPRPELAHLESWRDDMSPGLSIRLVHAEGGAGKTRLAAEFAARSAQAGWAVALVRHRSEVASAGGGDVTLTVRPPGLVMVVDYAERWPLEDLITLVRQHRDAARDRLRILLLARPTGTWWQGLVHQFAKLDILDVQAIRLKGLPDTPGVRAGMYVAARDRFAEIFAHADPARIGVPERLDDPVFALTLTVHMRALVDVDAASRGQSPPTGSGQASLSSYLLDREHDHWRSLHDQGHGPMRTPEQTMGRAVYVATLTRSLDPAHATTALARTGVVAAAGAGRLIRDHARCYPPTDAELVLDPLSPDRLGEDYLALTLPGHEEEFGYHATDPWTAAAPALLLAPDGQDGQPPAHTRHTLSVMVEAAHRWPHVTARHLDPLLRRTPTLALVAGSAALSRLADLPTLDISVLQAIERHFPARRHSDLDVGIAAITRRLAHHRLATTQDPLAHALTYDKLATRLSYAGLRDEALAAGRDAVRAWRHLARTDPVHDPALANSLTNLSNRLSQAGGRAEAVTTAQEAVEIQRGLAASNPGVYEPFLAASLDTLGNNLSEAGEYAEALAVEEQAVDIRRRLATLNPGSFDDSLASSLSNLANRLADAGRHTEAVTAGEEAARLYQRLATENPAAFEPDLARCLSNLGGELSTVGRHAESLVVEQQAVDIRRRLAEHNPGAFEDELAGSLSNLANRLSEVGRHAEAVMPIEEAVEIRRRLAAHNPAVFEHRLARSLSNLGTQLGHVGRYTEALAVEQQAVEIRRRLAEHNPAAFEDEWARSLSNLANRLAQTGQYAEAVPYAEEAVTVIRRLVVDNPAAHEPDLATALSNLGAHLARVGRHAEALTAQRQAVGIRRRLAARNPAAFAPDLARSLANLGADLAVAGRQAEALTAIGEAVAAFRRLTADNPAVHEPGLAFALVISALVRSEAKQGLSDALHAIREAVEIYQRLAVAAPGRFGSELHDVLNLQAEIVTRLGDRTV
jgi:tetratricopeptide (TPR) repeat protein